MTRSVALSIVFGISLASAPALAQPSLTMPQPSPAARVAQTVGLTEITVHYHRPLARGRKLWGGLVPYDTVWRAGANENTTVTFSTPVTIEGASLAAGTYGLHMVPGQASWEVIFSTNSWSWGSYAYDPAEDALRVTVEPVAGPHTEALAYTFDDLSNGGTTLTLRWGELAVPVRIEVATADLVIASAERELEGIAGFSWQPWAQLAAFALANDIRLDDAIGWVDRSIGQQRAFTNLNVKARILEAQGEGREAAKLREEALALATESEINLEGYRLMTAGDLDGAIALFKRNVKAHPGSWNVHDSLAEALATRGDLKGARTSYTKALRLAPDGQKTRIQSALDGLSS